MTKPILSAEELMRIYQDDDVVLADVSNSADASKKYRDGHLEKAVFIDLNKDLANIGDPKYGGRHPLPDPEKFIEVLARNGIRKNSRVVIYDRQSGANAAARFWWLLRAIGHEKVQVLDGGFDAAVEKGFPVTSVIPEPAIGTDHIASAWKLPLISIDEVRKAIGHKTIIDVRESARYTGETEPIDLIAGHIPSAINIPYKSNLDSSGLFKSSEELKSIYQIYANDAIVHCGSGVTACHTLLAFAIAGLEIPTLYVGSWSEWSRRTNDR